MASSTGIRAGAAYVELFLKNNLSKGLANAEKSVRAFAVRLTDVGKKMLGVSAVVAAPLVAASKVFADSGDSFEKMAQRTGVSVEVLQELAFAAKQSGTDMDNLEGGMRRMQKTLVDAASGSASAQESLATLGLSVKDLLGLAPDEQFARIADGLVRISDPTLKAAAAMDIFGKTGTTLLPLMSDGARGIDALRTEFRALGVTMSREDAAAAARMGDALDKTWVAAKAGTAIIGGALAPAITRAAGVMTKIVATAAQWAKKNQGLITSIAAVTAGVGAAGVALYGVGTAVEVVSKAMGVLSIAVKGAAVAMGLLASPMGLLGAGVLALGGYIVYASGVGGKALRWLGDRFGELSKFAGDSIRGISSAMAAGDLGLAAKIAWMGMKIAYQEGIAEIQKIWGAFKIWSIDAGIQVFQGVLGTVNDFWYGMRVAWVEGVAALKGIMATFMSWHQKVVEETTDWMATGGPGKLMLTAIGRPDIANAIDQGQSQDKDYLAKQHNGRMDEIKSETDAQLAAIAAEREARRQAEADRWSNREAAIGSMSGDAIAAARSQAADAVVAARAELAQTQQELKAALARASQAAPLGASGPAGMAGIADIGDLLSGVTKRTIGVAGTFNSAETRGLGAGSAVDRLVQINDAQDKKLGKLVDMARGGRLVFE